MEVIMIQRIRHLIYFLILIAIDQGSKFWVRTSLKVNGPIELIPKTLSLDYHENTGAVWGIMSGKVSFLRILTLLILFVILYLYIKIPQQKKYNPLQILSVFIMAGAIGNLIDRFYLGYVVDFIYFELINFPIFNIADSYLTVSCVFLLILALFYYKDNDFDFISFSFSKKNKSVPDHNDENGK